MICVCSIYMIGKPRSSGYQRATKLRESGNQEYLQNTWKILTQNGPFLAYMNCGSVAAADDGLCFIICYASLGLES
jgi:hypothetical protein